MLLLSDLRYAARTLRKAPAFTLAATLTLALAIGANTAIFTVFNAVMLRSLPFAQPDRLVWIAEKNDKLKQPFYSASVLNYLSWRERSQSFEQMGAIKGETFSLTGRGDPEQFEGNAISPSLFPLLGVKPVAGRGFRDDEDRPGSAPVAMIGGGLWKRRFGGDLSLIGQKLTLSGVSYTVVGIAPDAPTLLSPGEIWTPLTVDRTKEQRLQHVILAIGRIKPGVTVRQAQAEMDTLSHLLGIEYPEIKDWGIHLQTFYDLLVPLPLRTALAVLMGTVVLVLLIAAANVANLLLSRAASRQKEIAVRIAVGSGRARLLRQLLTESLALSLAGGGAGLAAADWAVHLMSASLPPGLLPVERIRIDSAVLFFSLGITIAAGLLFGIVPACQALRTNLAGALKEGGRTSSGDRRILLRSGLVAGELALATMLLIGAGLLLQSLLHLQNVRLGFRPDGLLTFQLSPPPAKYPSLGKSVEFYRELVNRLRELPGVRGAAVSTGLPFGAGLYSRTPMAPVGPSLLNPGDSVAIDWRAVSPDYFRALQIPLLQGRLFTDADDFNGPAVAIVSQETARQVWGSADPLGRVLRVVGSGKELTVVGVVGDVRALTLNDDPGPALYYSAWYRMWPTMDVVVRSAGDPVSALAGARRRVQELDPEMPLANVRPMDEWISTKAAQPRLNAWLVAAFACVALALAAIGVYGVLSYSVNQRTREIGLRMALGAERGSVLRLVVREGMMVAAVGIGVGLVAALATSRVLASLLYGVPQRDPVTFACVAVCLALVALAACAIPAWRASKMDPMAALRCE